MKIFPILQTQQQEIHHFDVIYQEKNQDVPLLCSFTAVDPEILHPSSWWILNVGSSTHRPRLAVSMVAFKGTQSKVPLRGGKPAVSNDTSVSMTFSLHLLRWLSFPTHLKKMRRIIKLDHLPQIAFFETTTPRVFTVRQGLGESFYHLILTFDPNFQRDIQVGVKMPKLSLQPPPSAIVPEGQRRSVWEVLGDFFWGKVGDFFGAKDH